MPNPDPVAVDELVRRNYGYLASFLSDPEIGPILRQAATEGWDAARLQGAVYNTDWWKKTSQTQRSWEALNAQDPAEANRQVQAKESMLIADATKLGVTLTQDRAHQMAIDSIQFGWTDQQLAQNLGSEAHFNAAQPIAAGDIGSLQRQVRSLANDYFVPISDQTSWDWAQKWATGQADQGAVTSYMATMALSRWPTLAEQIKQGLTPKQIFDPYVQQAAQLLEKPPQQIDVVNSPQFSKMIDFVDQQGNRRPMTLSESAQFVRGMPDWRHTQQANQEGSQVLEGILHDFGKVA